MEFSVEVLSQLRKALNDPMKKKIITRDPAIVGGLVLVLSNTDMKIVIEALEVLLVMAEPVQNRPFLHEFIGMKEQLHTLSSETNPLDHVRVLSSRLSARFLSEEPVTSANIQLKARHSNIQHTATTAMHAKKSERPLMFLNAKKLKTITLQIKGLKDRHDMELCREKLLTVRGVVSITFDLLQSRSIIRVKPELSSMCLATAVKSTQTMVAEQVIKDENGDEKFISLSDGAQTEKENNTMPAYLPDDDSPVKIDDKAVRRFGTEDDKQGGGWLTTAASFLANSFYW